MTAEWERGTESPENSTESQTGSSAPGSDCSAHRPPGRSLGSCACKVPSHTLPPNVLTLRARDTVPNVQTGTLSLRAAGTCSTLHSWTLAAVRSGSWPRTLTEGGAVGAGPSTLRDRDSRPSQSHRGEGSGEPGTAPRAPPPRPSLSPREGHSGLSSDSCPAREAPLTFALERLSS